MSQAPFILGNITSYVVSVNGSIKSVPSESCAFAPSHPPNTCSVLWSDGRLYQATVLHSVASKPQRRPQHDSQGLVKRVSFSSPECEWYDDTAEHIYSKVSCMQMHVPYSYSGKILLG